MLAQNIMKKDDLPESQTRTLYYFPIVHTQVDMGRFSGELTQATLKMGGQRGLHRKLQAIDQVWVDIRQVIEALDLPFNHVRVYQDGLPVCGREAEIVAELAQAGSVNYQLLLLLQSRGAVLMGTESPELLLREYDQLRNALAATSLRRAGNLERTRQAMALNLLKDRDRFIASRINTTLQPGETGILFLGLLHSPTPFLDPDIKIIYPLERFR
jgi:hypothetical protein